jgi:hypothetical protein
MTRGKSQSRKWAVNGESISVSGLGLPRAGPKGKPLELNPSVLSVTFVVRERLTTKSTKDTERGTNGEWEC